MLKRIVNATFLTFIAVWHLSYAQTAPQADAGVLQQQLDREIQRNQAQPAPESFVSPPKASPPPKPAVNQFMLRDLRLPALL